MQRNAPVRLTSTTLLPLLDRQVFERHGGRAGAGVVEQQVEPAEGLLRLVEERLHRGVVADVGRHHEGLSARGLALRRGRFERLLAPSGKHDGVAGLHQRDRRRPADAAAGARHERDLFW